MTDTFAKTARPAATAIAWCDRTHILVEFPVKDGPPYVTRFPKTTDGLIRALNILIENPTTETRTVAASHPAVRRVAPTFSEETRVTAAEIVRRMLKA